VPHKYTVSNINSAHAASTRSTSMSSMLFSATLKIEGLDMDIMVGIYTVRTYPREEVSGNTGGEFRIRTNSLSYILKPLASRHFVTQQVTRSRNQGLFGCLEIGTPRLVTHILPNSGRGVNIDYFSAVLNKKNTLS